MIVPNCARFPIAHETVVVEPQLQRLQHNKTQLVPMSSAKGYPPFASDIGTNCAWIELRLIDRKRVACFWRVHFFSPRLDVDRARQLGF